jgi:hypothetical protein
MYLIIAILCTTLSGYLFKKASGTISLRSPNMMSLIFYFYFFINNVIGAVLIVYQIDEHYAVGKLSNDIYRYYGFWTIMYTIVSFPLGQIIANKVFINNKMDIIYKNYLSKELINEPLRKRNHVRNTMLLFSLISVVSVIYTLITIGGSPLSAILNGADVMDFGMMRADAKRNFSGNEYFKNFGITFTPLLSYIVYGYMKLCNRRFEQLWFWIMFISSILILTYDLEKAPVLFYLIGFLFFKVYMGYKLSNKLLISFFFFILFMILLLYITLLSFDINTMFVFNQGPIGRMILSSNAGVFLTYDIFPKNHDFLGFSSFSRILSDVFGLHHSERSARYVMELVNPSGVSAGTAGVCNSLFVSEAWANWGITGVIFSPIYVGFLIQCLYLFFLSKRKTPFYLGIFVFYTIRSSINGGINDYIYNVTTFLVFILYFFTYHYLFINTNNPKNEKSNFTLSVQNK